MIIMYDFITRIVCVYFQNFCHSFGDRLIAHQIRLTNYVMDSCTIKKRRRPDGYAKYTVELYGCISLTEEMCHGGT